MSVEISGAGLILGVLGILFGGGTLGVIGVKLLSKPVDDATAAKLQAEAKATAQQTASNEVDTLREIIAEVRASEAKKSARIDALEARLDKVEERERHALTRAAVHESWDALAWQFILKHDPDFSPPPPLAGGRRRIPASRELDGTEDE